MVKNASTHYDVAIIGGGPGGSTLGALLRKYDPSLRIVIFEKEKFPRSHIGESLLPPISLILQEMGCWDEVEAAEFPIKIGATYTWGKTREPWIFEFAPLHMLSLDDRRPAKYEGWRVLTAFQVDRSIYDDILLRRAGTLGCEVRQQTRVAEIRRDGDRVTGFVLDSGEVITARYYIDASGNAAVLRRAMGVKVDAPTKLRNVAFWDYWQNPAWAESIGAGPAHIAIRSLPYGWMWFILIGKMRVSFGLVTPADYYKKTGKRPEDLYMESVRMEPTLQPLLVGATRRGHLDSTTDWSYVVDRTFGENWFLVGECSGFADPILSAGVTLTQTGARELAYTIMELDRAELERTWLLERYDELQRRRVRQHMRFADYWYSANGIFENIRENCTEIARESGVKLDAEDAFRWLSWGGLGDDVPGQVGIGGLDVAGVKQVMLRFTGDKGKGRADWLINGKNVFKLNLAGAEKMNIGLLRNGRIIPTPCYVRAERRLPMVGAQEVLVEILRKHSSIEDIMGVVQAQYGAVTPPEHMGLVIQQMMQLLEVMANDYWVTCSVKKGKPLLDLNTPEEGERVKTMTNQNQMYPPHAAMKGRTGPC